MKRNTHIVPLSKDHHHGLLFCWKIRQGLKKHVETGRIAAYVQYFWDGHLVQHFQEEEELLFTLEGDALCMRAQAEHKLIKAQVEHVVNGTVHADVLTNIADLVDDHIRFEERVLFPHLEQTLTETQLQAIGQKLEQLHQHQEPDNFADQFWA
ncbi:MAG TPA: hemerythrin domain-containing protein [Phnomibacter sp.]|nr:hemerythrin domain-containing protein [Phnomibacter sp.]